ncbi:hypothetical protein PP1Y_Lpl1326 (plasmid) [Novosphingobium sp. PP1Y]|nr:hypothetical protein PP1Y_Lpl1326 [Novosphingobium sp. PP1Y]
MQGRDEPRCDLDRANEAIALLAFIAQRVQTFEVSFDLFNAGAHERRIVDIDRPITLDRQRAPHAFPPLAPLFPIRDLHLAPAPQGRDGPNGKQTLHWLSP